MGFYALYYGLPAASFGSGDRYYVTSLTGDGSSGNPYQPDIPAVAHDVAMIPTDANGQPTSSWTMVVCNIDSETQLLRSGAIRLPNPSDPTVSLAVRLAITAFTGVSLVTAVTGEDVITAVARALDPSFQPGEGIAAGSAIEGEVVDGSVP